MSEKDKCCGECSSHESECGAHCGHGFACGKSFFFTRWIFGLIILIVVFCTGIAIGRFLGEADSGYGFQRGGYSRMMQFGNGDYTYGPGMMRSYIIQTTDDKVAAPVVKTVK